MPDQKTFTLAEFREAQRDGFEAGAQFAACRASGDGWVSGDDVLAFQKEAERRYPQPMKPRVVATGVMEYRVVDGALQCRPRGEDLWRTSGDTKHYKMIADLLAHPTEPSDE